MNVNIRHSTVSPNWISPQPILRLARHLFDGQIDLDPASSPVANEYVQAVRFFTPVTNGLARAWKGRNGHPVSVWLNPPGGFLEEKRGKSKTKRWWNKLLDEREEPYFGHGLFLSFSIETMQTTQNGCQSCVLDFLTCVFDKRLAYIDAKTGRPVSGMTHSSCISYLPGRVNKAAEFARIFQPHGRIIRPHPRVKAA